jgi:hypothetical protein
VFRDNEIRTLGTARLDAGQSGLVPHGTAIHKIH